MTSRPWNLAAAALVGATLVSSPPARAEDRVTAQALFDAAMKLIDAHDYAAACPKLEDVVRLQPGKVGAMMELARCYELGGKLASAWARYRAAADAAAPQDARGKVAAAKAAEVDPMVPRMKLAIAAETRALAGLKITRDGDEVKLAEIDVTVPLDPGKHKVAVFAPGKLAWTQTVDLSPQTTTRVDVPALDDEPAPKEEAPPPPASPGPWIVGGVGIASLVVGAVTGGIVIKDRSTTSSDCTATPAHCTPAGHSAATQGSTLGPVSTVALVLGVAGVGGGVTWLVLRKKRASDPTVGVGPWMTATTRGLGVEGSFR